jgi:hypothetical protein
MAAPTVLIAVELSLAGITRARDDLDGIAAIVEPTGESTAPTASTPPAAAAVPDIVTVYKHAARHTKSKTPRLIELFAREQKLLTPTEIGIGLGNGKPLSKAQARAVMRNLQQTQGYLLKEGRISRPVLVRNFDRYDVEDSGRFGFSEEDTAALRNHLGIS